MTPASRANFGIFVDDTQKKKPEKTGKERFFNDD
jgi:hypothetical protein